MLSLFDTGGRNSAATRTGYRLKTLEVFNWGTFHEGNNRSDIWKLSLDGNNTLLTGANGSGKTTLVDGLLALLVNPQKRFFNQSSGAKSARERTEESYVEGHYSRTQSEDQQNSRVEKLRPNRSATYSIILGVFTNEGAASTPVTLAQIRWFNNSGLQRKYVIAKLELTIADHIQFSTDGNWLRKLKRQFADRIDDFDAFPKYAARFQQLFGMRSDKALTLFNQTVGMKILGDLDEFIRTNMLEESTAEDTFKKLMDNYQTLLVAYQALEKARIQLSLLKPVYDLSHAYAELENRIREAEGQQRLLEPWFARQQGGIWQAEIARQERELKRLEDKLATQEQQLEELREQEKQVYAAKENNKVDQKIKELAQKIKGLEEIKTDKKEKLIDYNRFARPLGFVENPDEVTFRENTERAVTLQQSLVQDRERVGQQKFDTQTKVNGLKTDFDKLTAEITQLLNSTGKVTGRPAEIRQEILEAVNATEADIPFVAEVMQVRDDQKAVWNNAIEKVLHSLGLNLLVPTDYYSAVTEYVNAQTDLRGKVVFQLVAGKPGPPIFPDPRTLVAKLDFNPKSRYIDWVENHIFSRFNYLCTENRSEFERAEKALLPSGLNRTKNRHERDDSTNHRHILGWDNRELLREKQRKGRELSDDITKLNQALNRLVSEEKKIDEDEKRLMLFLTMDQFSKLDWQADALKIADLSRQKEQLENSNQTLKTLLEQLEMLRKNIANLSAKKDSTRDEFKDTERTIKTLQEEKRGGEYFLDNFDSEDIDIELNRLDDLTSTLVGQLNFGNFIQEKQKLENQLSAEIAALKSSRNKLEKDIEKRMSDFKIPKKEVRLKFPDWESETNNLEPDIDQLAEYVDRYEQIRDENLVELESRFQEEFKSGATKALSDYCNSLELQHERICETIDQINESLRGIAFNLNPDTYIQLERTDTRKPRIRDFRFGKLNSWQPDRTQMALATNPKEAEIEHFVSRIQPFINELQADEKWRQEVSDVRNWSDFKAREYFKTDQTPKQVYESSGSLSGGEAAQLAYTVLGAAIAFQFGINRDANTYKSFRFIVVDEAFSKLDEDKSKYLLQLCRSLGLQLMVVTPLTSIHLLENDVSVIHWVTRAQKDRRKSTVRDIPILEYKEKKETLLADASEA
ncbi:ATP-binding protein [Larkinella punicea]|uniref:Uncharacterized protein n=1 Tax=Larkinella punicea TaxID=2315727 RepID=A0A368JUZ0_9BACT|nr:SbcC/MukB-like Walker B domain-containing protein [Larkinella punicea]RCR71468.1 hypothetical protein DUE52_00595 [Larkinella punicea]